jgi:cytochrome d ubiquinol oxidase subunit I
MTAGAFVVGVAAYLYVKKSHDRALYRTAIRAGAWVLLIAGLGVAISGDVQGKIMTEVQPMKMAAAEGLYETESHAPFSVLSVGKLDGSEATTLIKVPGLLSYLATSDFNGEVKGINPLQEEYAAAYGENPLTAMDSYKPVIPVTYWSFRFMIGLGLLGALGAIVILLLTKGHRDVKKWVATLGILMPLLLVFANSWGWMFTEMGRQPWAVFGLMTTASSVSPGVSVPEALISVIVLTLLYAVLMVVELGLLAKYIKRGADPFEEPPSVPVGGSDDDAKLAFAY